MCGYVTYIHTMDESDAVSMSCDSEVFLLFPMRQVDFLWDPVSKRFIAE